MIQKKKKQPKGTYQQKIITVKLPVKVEKHSIYFEQRNIGIEIIAQILVERCNINKINNIDFNKIQGNLTENIGKSTYLKTIRTIFQQSNKLKRTLDAVEEYGKKKRENVFKLFNYLVL